MSKIWITYAWIDSNDGDVDYVAQELINVGLDVRIDRQQLRAGFRLWEQIDNSISNPEECDAWMIFATENSITSEPCREELAIALDRALNSRGYDFPLIGLFSDTIERKLIPGAIRTRLYVSLTDNDWVERVKAATEGRSPEIFRKPIQPYHIQIYPNTVRKGNGHSIEVRPRAGTWAPFLGGVPYQEKESVSPSLFYGPSGRVPNDCFIQSRRGADPNEEWWLMISPSQATPTMSFYIHCDKLPSKIVFGVDREKQFVVQIL